MVSSSFVGSCNPKLQWSISRTNCLYYSTRVDLYYSHQILLHPYEILLCNYSSMQCSAKALEKWGQMTHTIEKYGDVGNFSGVTYVMLPFMNLKFVGTWAPTAKIIGDISDFNVLNVPKTQPQQNPVHVITWVVVWLNCLWNYGMYGCNTWIPAWISNHMPSKVWVKLLIHSQNSAVAPLKFENG